MSSDKYLIFYVIGLTRPRFELTTQCSSNSATASGDQYARTGLLNIGIMRLRVGLCTFNVTLYSWRPINTTLDTNAFSLECNFLFLLLLFYWALCITIVHNWIYNMKIDITRAFTAGCKSRFVFTGETIQNLTRLHMK